MKKIIAVDLDQTLTIGEYNYWKDDIDDIKPNEKVVEWVKQQYWEGNFIVIYTARKEMNRFITEMWLKKYVVWFHVLVMDKLRADIYLDDRNMKLEDIK